MYQLFNTGDQVWSEWRNGKWVVVRVETHDGLVSDEREGNLVRLTGIEKVIHDGEVTALRALYRVLYQ